MTDKARVQLLVPLRNRAAFLDAYSSRSEEGLSGGGLFVPGDVDVQLGEEIDVELSFSEEQVRFHIRARVKYRRAEMRVKGIPAGIGIEFLSTEEQVHHLILRFVEGKERVTYTQRTRRWTLQVDVKLRHQGKELTALTDDISEGGCFVLTAVRLEVGQPVDVRLRAPGTLFGWLTLSGFIAWRRNQPGRDGVGIEFKFNGDRQRQKVQKILGVLKERSLRDVQIKVPRTSPPAPSAE